ncbi:MAG: response regulator [Oryzomonas sp.]|uniref:response regulator n=1 Tax=Oryzomonas sp. TaxID=2855186 RepID=UPI002846D2F1|nr:response regulator [Oryzomonas sp.]MDR3579253.1 response regulator [Oryzomonas sp.]
MTIEEAFGIVIRRLRRERMLSQDKLSSISMVDRAFISNIEGGKQQPSLITIFELANALNVTTSSIMVEVEFLLKINCPEILKNNQDGNLAWLHNLEIMMTGILEEFRGNETILIVDDELQLREMLSCFLSNYGYNVICANDGHDAIEIYKQNIESIRLSIMDIVMPRKDGITASKEIKELNPGAIILFISGYSPSYLTKTDDIDLIQKPFSPIEIIKKVRASLDLSRSC